MAESCKNPQPGRAAHNAGTTETPKPREQVFEEGKEVQNNPSGAREQREGTPIGSDPRE